MKTPLCVFQQCSDRVRHSLILRQFHFELFLSRCRDAVLPDLPPRLGCRPVSLHPPFDEEFLKSWIERAFLDTKFPGGELMNPLGDRVAMKRLVRQHAQHKHDECSWW